jgi:hypothetical protein
MLFFFWLRFVPCILASNLTVVLFAAVRQGLWPRMGRVLGGACDLSPQELVRGCCFSSCCWDARAGNGTCFESSGVPGIKTHFVDLRLQWSFGDCAVCEEAWLSLSKVHPAFAIKGSMPPLCAWAGKATLLSLLMAGRGVAFAPAA